MQDLLEAYCSETEIDESAAFEGEGEAIYQLIMQALQARGVPAQTLEDVSSYLGSDSFQTSFETQIMNGTDIFSDTVSDDAVDSLSNTLDSGAAIEDVSGLLNQSFGGQSIVEQFAGVLFDAASVL